MDKSSRFVQNRRGAIILAGGDSKRLGRPKALLDFHGSPLIEQVIRRLNGFFSALIVVTDRPELYQGLPVHFAGDLLNERQKSPLRGIHAGLSASDLPYQFVTACDMPFLNLDLIAYMAGYASKYEAVVPRIGPHYQPLHAFYSRSCIDLIERQVLQGNYKVTDFYARLNIRYIGREEIERFDPQQRSFFNINTWEDYYRALESLAGERYTG